MKIGDLVLYSSNLYQISVIDWSSLANRFKLKPVAVVTPDQLRIFDNSEIYVGNSEKLELFNGSSPKYYVGERVKYSSTYYFIRFVLIKEGTYYYQLKPEETGRSYEWVYENQLG
jgi:hypothetical protein